MRKSETRFVDVDGTRVKLAAHFIGRSWLVLILDPQTASVWDRMDVAGDRTAQQALDEAAKELVAA